MVASSYVYGQKPTVSAMCLTYYSIATDIGGAWHYAVRMGGSGLSVAIYVIIPIVYGQVLAAAFCRGTFSSELELSDLNRRQDGLARSGAEESERKEPRE